MMRSISLLAIILLLVSCQKKTPNALTHQLIETESDEIFDKLVEARRDFHKYPELAKQETRTKEAIKKYLLNLGLEVITSDDDNSVVGILRGSKAGKKIAWRADMDALPHSFSDDVAFKSTVDGVQHGCGHDVHMAIGLGIAEVFSKYKKSLKGTVYFIFQPEEETFLGAKNMIANGLFNSISPDEIYTLHVTALPVGKLMVKPNELYAYQKRIQISLDNQISKTEATKLYHEIKNLMTRTQDNSQPWDLQQIIDEETGLSVPNTPFKDYCFMDENPFIETIDDNIYINANLYETNKANLDNILPRIEMYIKSSKHKNLFNSLSFTQENPTVINDESLTRKAVASLEKIYGEELVLTDYGQIPYFNDDFCYFQQQIPGVYFLLGGSNFEKDIIAMNHTPSFKVDEECIRVAVRSFSSLILERLNGE